MSDKENGFVSQEETGQVAPIDAVEERVEKKMEELKDEARESVKEGLGATENDTPKR